VGLCSDIPPPIDNANGPKLRASSATPRGRHVCKGLRRPQGRLHAPCANLHDPYANSHLPRANSHGPCASSQQPHTNSRGLRVNSHGPRASSLAPHVNYRRLVRIRLAQMSIRMTLVRIRMRPMSNHTTPMRICTRPGRNELGRRSHAVGLKRLFPPSLRCSRARGAGRLQREHLHLAQTKSCRPISRPTSTR
jgi:hypothetical protein